MVRQISLRNNQVGIGDTAMEFYSRIDRLNSTPNTALVRRVGIYNQGARCRGEQKNYQDNISGERG